jgi:ankyrin repeat protein
MRFLNNKINLPIGTLASVLGLIFTFVFEYSPYHTSDFDNTPSKVSRTQTKVENSAIVERTKVEGFEHDKNIVQKQINNSSSKELLAAAKIGDQVVLENLLISGLNPNVQDKWNRTALMLAISSGEIAAVRLLVNAGAYLNIPIIFTYDGVEYTPLLWAANNEIANTNIINFLLTNGASIKSVNANQENALMFAAQQGHTEMALDFIDKGINVNAVTIRNQTTALMFASIKGKVNVANLLIKKGADVNAKVNWGATALHFAAREYKNNSDHLAVMKLLLNNGADVNATVGNMGESSLMMVAFNGHTEAVKLLIKNGANVNYRDEDGRTAIDCKRFADSNDEIVDILRKAGAYESFWSKTSDFVEENKLVVALTMLFLSIIFIYWAFVLSIRLLQIIAKIILPVIYRFIDWKV